MKEETWDRLLQKIKSRANEKLFNSTNIHPTYIKGSKKLNKFLKIILDNKEKPFERHQFDCLVHGMPMFFYWIFGDVYMNSNIEKIKNSCKFVHDKNAMLIILKRQFGKTEFLVRVATASIICFDNPNIVNEMNEWIICSHKGDHAREILERCYNYLLENKKHWARYFTLKKNKSDIELTHKNNFKDKRRLVVHEGNIDGLARKKIFGDEFLKWTEDRADVQFPPQLQVEGTYAFLASTLRDIIHWSKNWIKEDNPLAHVINMGEICFKCIKLPGNLALKCPHRRKLQAHFVNEKKRKAVMDQMSKSKMLREMLNVVPNNEGLVWTEQQLRDGIVNWYDGPKPFVYHMFVDPSMTSEDGSHTALTIMGKYNVLNEETNKIEEKIIICGLNSSLTDSTTSIVNFVVDGLKEFFKDFTKNEGHVYLYVESNTIKHHTEILKKIDKDMILRKRVTYVKGIREKNGKYEQYGVIKKKGHDIKYCNRLNNCMIEKKICIHKDFVCPNDHLCGEDMIELLIEQCSRVKQVPKSDGKIKIVSKKEGTRNVNDDSYISLSSGLFHMKLIYDPDDPMSRNLKHFLKSKSF